MTKQQIAILKTLAGNLRGSTRPGWESGDLNAWTTFAKNMMIVIDSTANVLDAISSNNEEEKNEDKSNLTLD